MPRYKKTLSTWTNLSLTIVPILLAEENRENIVKLQSAVQYLVGEMEYAISGHEDAYYAISRMPRLTTALNRAKFKSLEINLELNDELRRGRDKMARILGMIEGFLNKNGTDN